MVDIVLKLSSNSGERISSYDHLYFTFYIQFHQISKEREKVESDMIQVKDEWRAKLRDTERLNSGELSVLQKDLNEQVNNFRSHQFLLINIIV